jgi:hypothetical protein
MSLQFSANGQTVTISNRLICFDSIAAKNAVTELNFLGEIISKQDTLIDKLNTENLTLTINLHEANRNYESVFNGNNALIGENMKFKRERNIWRNSFIGVCAASFLILVMR